MRVKQHQVLDIVEFAVKIDGLDVEVKAAEDTEKLCEDTASV